MKNQIKIIATEAFSSLVKDAMGPISLEQFATKSKISKIHLKRLLEGTLVETHRCIIRAIIDSSDGRITEEHASRVLNYNDWLFRGEQCYAKYLPMDNIDYAQLQASREINNDNEDFLSLDKSFPTFERLLQKLGEDEYKNLLQEFNQNPLAFQAAYQVLYQYINSTSNNRKEEE